MSLYARIADLPVTIDSVDRRRYTSETTSGFTRTTTECRLAGDGSVGRGEDVCYKTADHDALAETEPIDLTGDWTVATLSAHLDTVDLFAPEAPTYEHYRNYRRWAIESAALDLALRQRGKTLGEALGIDPDPVRFVVSTRLGEPPTSDRIERLLALDDTREFKLDPSEEWPTDLFTTLGATDAVRIMDLKDWYGGPDPDVEPELYHDVFGMDSVIVEDAAFVPETNQLVESRAERLSFDSPIDGVESLRSLPVEPGWCNIKPSRFGSLESLFETIEYCQQAGIDLYGGGQFELASGRTAIQTLAALFYPDAPNDVAPSVFNDPGETPPYPASPLQPDVDAVGFEF
ncbi:enolase [Halorubrum tebenquichense]|uniref:enolase n=1 Tax=Halorubrum tebenquichense TaxID=119434 RepID=UPI0006775A33|nr:enolase [Halorubrum tebenquichense]